MAYINLQLSKKASNKSISFQQKDVGFIIDIFKKCNIFLIIYSASPKSRCVNLYNFPFNNFEPTNKTFIYTSLRRYLLFPIILFKNIKHRKATK